MKYKFYTWNFREMGVWMDGGSITLYFTNAINQELTIDLQQYVSKDFFEKISKIPGRVYLQGEIVEKRSIIENSTLKHLKQNVVGKLRGLDKDILTDQIHWIESEKYMDLKPHKLTLSEARKRELESNKK